MKTAFLISLCLNLSVLAGFSPSQIDDNPLIGVWVYENWEGGTQACVRKDQFNPDMGGIEFIENGKIVKRQNVGWCGTPPISYGNFKGTWKQTSATTLTIQYEYWGGIAEQDLQIVELTESNLKFKTLEHRSVDSKFKK